MNYLSLGKISICTWTMLALMFSHSIAAEISDCRSTLVVATYSSKSARLTDIRMAEHVTKGEYDQAKQSGGANAVIYGVQMGANYDQFHKSASSYDHTKLSSLSDQQFVDIIRTDISPISLPLYTACLNAVRGLSDGLHLIPMTATQSDQSFLLRWRRTGTASREPVNLTWSGATRPVPEPRLIDNGDYTVIFLRPNREQTVTVNGGGLTDSVVISPLPPPASPTPPRLAACGGIANARGRYQISGDPLSGSFLVKIPPCGSFDLSAMMTEGTLPDSPPSPHIVTVTSSLCMESGGSPDLRSQFIRIHIDRGCGEPNAPIGPHPAYFYRRRSTLPLSDPSVSSNWAELVKAINERNLSP